MAGTSGNSFNGSYRVQSHSYRQPFVVLSERFLCLASRFPKSKEGSRCEYVRQHIRVWPWRGEHEPQPNERRGGGESTRRQCQCAGFQSRSSPFHLPRRWKLGQQCESKRFPSIPRQLATRQQSFGHASPLRLQLSAGDRLPLRTRGAVGGGGWNGCDGFRGFFRISEAILPPPNPDCRYQLLRVSQQLLSLNSHGSGQWPESRHQGFAAAKKKKKKEIITGQHHAPYRQLTGDGNQ